MWRRRLWRKLRSRLRGRWRWCSRWSRGGGSGDDVPGGDGEGDGFHGRRDDGDGSGGEGHGCGKGGGVNKGCVGGHEEESGGWGFRTTPGSEVVRVKIPLPSAVEIVVGSRACMTSILHSPCVMVNSREVAAVCCCPCPDTSCC